MNIQLELGRIRSLVGATLSGPDPCMCDENWRLQTTNYPMFEFAEKYRSPVRHQTPGNLVILQIVVLFHARD